ncbi:MAG: PGF-pre-PGF domain-containing protein [Nanoarchaeota archaeon]|nr:PGF-pre-PGF domain-containing protein [Nanoarchaeota archaeon]
MKANKRGSTAIMVIGVVVVLLLFASALIYFKGRITGYVVYAPPSSCYNNNYACIDLSGDGQVDYDDETIFAQILNGTITNTTEPEIYLMADFDNNGIVDNAVDFQQCFVYFRDEAKDKANGTVTCNRPEDNLTGRVNLSECTNGCPDLNGDGYVNDSDSDILSGIFDGDMNASLYPMADLTGDGDIDWQDKDCFTAFNGKIVTCNLPMHKYHTSSCPDITDESDTGNDGYVNAVDQGLFVLYESEKNLKADLNGDNKINLIDRFIFEQYLGKVVTCNLYHAPWHIGGIDQNNSDTTEYSSSPIGNAVPAVQNFTTSREGQLPKIRFYLKYDNGSAPLVIADDIIVRIHPDAAGMPNISTLIAETIIPGFTDNETHWETAYFAIPPILDNNTQYHIILSSPDSTDAAYQWISNAGTHVYEQFSSTACADINGDGICNLEDEEIIERLPDGLTSDGVGDYNSTFDINKDYIINQTDYDIVNSAIGTAGYLEKPTLSINNSADTGSSDLGNIHFLGQSFKAANTRLSKISLYLAANSIFKRDVTVKVMNQVNDLPGSAIGSISITGFDNSSFNWYEFVFDNSIDLAIGDVYYIIISASDASSADAYSWSLGSAYANGQGLQSTDSGSSWVNLTGKDFAFKIYSGDSQWNDTYDVNDNSIIGDDDLNLILSSLGSWDGVWWTPLVDFNAEFGRYDKLLDKTLGFDAYKDKVLTCGLPTWSAFCGNARCDKDENFSSCLEDCPSCNYDGFCSTTEDFENCDDCIFWKALPEFGKFNGDTTLFYNFSAEEMESVSNMVLEILPYGRIEFSDQINASRLDFDSYVDINENYVSINSSALPGLNISARITLYNLSFIYPNILIDSASCDDACIYYSYDDNSLIFDVAGFNSYSAEELAPDAIIFNGSTTNFSISLIPDLDQVSNLVIENTAHGMIHFLEIVNVTKGNYSRDISIGDSVVSINTSADPRLNKSARIELYNLSFYQPIIYIDGSQCPGSICRIETYPFSTYEQLCSDSNCTLVFNVSHFSEYDIRENTTAPQFIHGPIDAITFDANTEARLNISNYFFDMDNDTLIYDAIISTSNIGIRFEDGDAILNNTLGWSGIGWINFSASDGVNIASSGDVPVLVLTNRPPQYENDPISCEITLWEEEQNNTIDLGYYFNDPDDDNMSFSYSFIGSSENITITINNTKQKAYLVPDADWHGSRFVIFSAADEEFITDSTKIELKIESINDLPEMKVDINITIIGDEDYNLSLYLPDYFEDIEDDAADLDYSIISIPVNFNVNFTGANVTFIPNPNWFGNEVFKIKAIDSDGGIGYSNNFTIYIKQVNDPVTRINKTFDLTWNKNKNQSINLSDYFEDIDGDAIFWYSHALPSNISIDLNYMTGEINFISLQNWSGTEQVNLSAIDPISSVSEIVNLSVIFVDVINSSIAGVFYAYDISMTIPDIIGSTTIFNSTITGPTIEVVASEIYNSTIINSPVWYCNISDAVLENNFCENSFIDPSDVRESNTTGSIIINSEIWHSDAINSTFTDATVHYSEVMASVIENSTLYKTKVTGATIINESIYNGTILLPNGSNQTIISEIDLADVINYPPIAVINTNIVSGTAALNVNFDAFASTDSNIPGALNDSLEYSWDFNNDGVVDAAGNSTVYTYGSGTFTAVLIVTDKFNESSSHEVVITVSPAATSVSSSRGGGGGGGGGRLRAGELAGAKYSRFYSYLDAGTTEVKISHVEIALKSLSITTSQGVSRVNFIVQEVENLSLMDNPPEDAYQYLSIKAEGLTDDMTTDVIYNFSISKSWFGSQYDKDNVYLQRYNNGNWQKNPTVFIGEDDSSYYYEASTSGLSYFAITAKQIIAPPAEPAVKPAEVQQVIEKPKVVIQKEEIKKPVVESEEIMLPEEEVYGLLGISWIYIVVAAIVLLIIAGAGIGFVFYEKAKKKSLREKLQLKKLKEESMEQLHNYAWEMMQQGYSKDQIREILLKEGWDESILDELFMGFE